MHHQIVLSKSCCVYNNSTSFSTSEELEISKKVCFTQYTNTYDNKKSLYCDTVYHCSENCPIQEFSFSMLNSAAWSTVTCFIVGLFGCFPSAQGLGRQIVCLEMEQGRRISQHYHAHLQNRRKKKTVLVANRNGSRNLF